MSTPTEEEFASNGLLSTLNDDDRMRLAPHIVALDLEVHQSLHEAGEEVLHTWFPCRSAMAAYCVNVDDKAAVEVAVVGSEGAIGGIVSNGHIPAFATAQVRSAGRFCGSRPPHSNKPSSIPSASGTGFHVIRTVFSRSCSRPLRAMRRTRSCSAPRSGCSPSQVARSAKRSNSRTSNWPRCWEWDVLLSRAW